jgi:tRNA pseudouridine38-40 synthase
MLKDQKKESKVRIERVKLLIEYDGTDFFGWQIQPNKRTVQGEIENALKKIYKKRIKIEGAGRTDKGVHAYGMVASLNVTDKLSPLELKNAINGNVGSDIFVKECTKVSNDFHARFSALSRIYQYQIYKGKSVFKRRYFLNIKEKINIDLMKRASERLVGKRDFSNLSTKDKGICDMKSIEIKKNGNEIYIIVEADHFLRRMVLGIVGLLLEVGKGNLELEDVEKVISGKVRRTPVSSPKGLILMKVSY